MEGDGISCLNKLFRALIVVLTLLQCDVSHSLSFVFKNISSGGVTRCFEREREALLAFKHGLVDDYNLLSSWGGEEQKQNCCKWVGVHCSNQTNHVTHLHLGWFDLGDVYSLRQKGEPVYFYLQGKMMSPRLIELHHLKYLDLSSINFNGTQLPDFIGSLSNLRHLDLSFASFGGRFPTQFGNLTHLQYLDLKSNHFANLENLNSWLPHLSSLTYLDLSNTNLSNVPSPMNLHSFSNLCSLQSLNLGNTSLSGQFSKFVQMLSTCVQNSLVTLNLCNNRLSGSIPNLTNFSSLKELHLCKNQLSGTIPESIGQMSNLKYMDLGMNALEGVISESHFSGLSRLWYLDLSSNLLALNFNSDWVPPFQLGHIDLGSCKMGPYFPNWLQTQNNYIYLNIYDAGIVDIFPSWFLGMTRNMTFISPSNNQIGGPIPSPLSHASYLDLSNNKISGSISILCEPYSRLTFLNLSSNILSGELPECLTHFDNLVMLDLSYNAFSGKIPSTIGSLYRMETLKLRSNKFVGELPSSLKNCTCLQVIDVGYNQLSGRIPKWLGVSLQKLVILMLSSNNFSGSTPSELCRLTNIINLDVSVNNISGTIPKCLSNFTVLAQKGNSYPILHLHHMVRTYGVPYKDYTAFIWTGRMYFHYEDDATFIWKGRLYSYRSTLWLVKRIDFSSNRLAGEIPSEITDLVGLVFLNLSRNGLTGELPAMIGKLQSLDALDLSRNKIDGRIPTSLVRVDRLSVLDLSYNNFIGKIPTGTQLQSFDPSVYAGNPQLCGPPLQKMCGDQQKTPISSNEEEKDEPITSGFYICMALGFIVGFWGFCGSLIFVRTWRYSYFRFLNVLNDYFYVRVISIKLHFN